MKKYLIILLLCVSAVSGYCQQGEWQEFFSYGWKPERVWPKQLLKPPMGDTALFSPSDHSIMFGLDGLPYYSDGSKWSRFNSGASSGVIALNDSTYVFGADTLRFPG